MDEADSLVLVCFVLMLIGVDWVSFVREGVVVGTVGCDMFWFSVILIVDLGGDDVYLDVGWSFLWLFVVVIVDLVGDDMYEGVVGLVEGGVLFVFDLLGDDRYMVAEVS